MAQNKMAGGKLMHSAGVCGNEGKACTGPSSIPAFRSSRGAVDAARSSNRGGMATHRSKGHSRGSKRGY